MIKAILVGASGKMGGFITDCAANDSEIEIIAGVDKVNIGQKYPIFANFDGINTKADVIIDFSNPVLLDSILNYATRTNTAVVLATTGYNDEQIAKIKAVSKQIPIFFTFNMSIGVNLLCSLAKKSG